MKPYRNVVGVVIVLSVSGNAHAQQASVEGLGTEFEVRNYARRGVPLLQNFYFRFTSSDRHIQVVEVMPGQPDADKLSLGYFDDSRNDEYFFRSTHFEIPNTAVQTAKIASVFSGTERRRISRPGPDFTFVLIGFSFRYAGDDHHIETIAILQEDRADGDASVIICFKDVDADKFYTYEVEYAWVPNRLLLNQGATFGAVTDGSGGDSRPIPSGGVPVIRGFELRFGDIFGDLGPNGEAIFAIAEDHHLKEVGVLSAATTSGELEVYYSDRNRDDDFAWEVRWGILRPGTVFPGKIILQKK